MTTPSAVFSTLRIFNSPPSAPLKVFPLALSTSVATSIGRDSVNISALITPLNSLSDRLGLSPFFRATAVSW